MKTYLIFEFYGVEEDLKRALKRKVWLDSGGYLVIDQTEALTSIDVNTGKYTGSKNLADKVLRPNRGGREIGLTAAPAGYRRHHHHRLYRYGFTGR